MQITLASGGTGGTSRTDATSTVGPAGSRVEVSGRVAPELGERGDRRDLGAVIGNGRDLHLAILAGLEAYDPHLCLPGCFGR